MNIKMTILVYKHNDKTREQDKLGEVLVFGLDGLFHDSRVDTFIKHMTHTSNIQNYETQGD